MKVMLLPLVLILSGTFGTSALADVRELARSELRENVRLGNSMSLSRLISVMEAKTDGKLVDVRGFKADQIYYHVVLKKPDGKLMVAVVDARSGKFMSRNSSIVRDVLSATKSKSKSNKSTSSNNGNNGNGNGNSGNGTGNGNSGNGNGNGNSGNGNGNSGSNGNSGGNGGGNSGGNGGGNSGGGGGKK